MKHKIAYPLIVIIFNPHSTGGAAEKAQALKKALHTRGITNIKLMKTTHKGHARQLAYTYASKKEVLLVSVSGDGGYNEVISGAVEAAVKFDTNPICVVEAAGNANDHYHATRNNNVVEAILKWQPAKLDIMRLKVSNGTVEQYYAHSYIGFGVTPHIAHELNRHNLNRWREMLIVISARRHVKPFTIVINTKRRQFDSIIYANVDRMAKVIKLSSTTSAHDGYFERFTVPHRNVLRLLLTFLKATIVGWSHQARMNQDSFTMIHGTVAQLDGETVNIKSASKITIDIIPDRIRTI